MPIPDLPLPKRSPSIEELANIVGMYGENLGWLMEGNLDDINIRRLTADKIYTGTLDAGLVTVRAEYEGGAFIELSSAGIRINDGEKDTFTADANGYVTMTGGRVQSSYSAYPRVDFDAGTGNIFKASKNSAEYVAIDPDLTGSPTLLIESPGAKGFISPVNSAGVVAVNATVGDLQLKSQDGDTRILASGYVRFEDWSKVYSDGDMATLQQELDSIKSRLASLEARPIYVPPPPE